MLEHEPKLNEIMIVKNVSLVCTPLSSHRIPEVITGYKQKHRLSR